LKKQNLEYSLDTTRIRFIWNTRKILEYSSDKTRIKFISNECLNVSEYARMFKNMPECSRICQNILKFQKYHKVPEYSRIFQNIPEYDGMFQNMLDILEYLT
jgi:hypothetical protein